jgi:hypothetical protein
MTDVHNVVLESVGTLIAAPPVGAPVPPILPPQNGFLGLDRAQVAADLPASQAAFMADSQLPWVYASQPASVVDVIKRAAHTPQR